MANERITEDLVDDRLRELGYYEDAEKIIVEKQQSGIELVRKSCLLYTSPSPRDS